MSLRVRLFLTLSALVALLVLAQWWWTRALTRDLADEVDEVAFAVGSSVAAVFFEARVCTDDDCEDTVAGRWTGEAPVPAVRRRFVLDDGEQRGEAAQAADGAALAAVDLRLRQLHATFCAERGAEHPEVCAEGVLAGDDGKRSQVMIVRTMGDQAPAEGEPAATPADAGTEPAGIRYGYRQLPPETLALIDVERRQVDHHLVMRLTGRLEDGAAAAGNEFTSAPREHRIEIPTRGIRDRIDRFSQRMLLGSAGFLGLGLALAALIAHRVTSPLRQLSAAAGRLGTGALGTQVAVRTGDREVRHAITAFNRMSGQLAALDRRSKTLAARQHLSEIGEIARGLAHSLRNPLNALGLSLEELAAQAPRGALGDGLVMAARRQIRRIDHSIRSFLALASEGAGSAGRVDLRALLEDVVLEALQDGGRRLRIDLDAGAAGDGEDGVPDVVLHGVEPELRAVLQALVVNAVEASPDGSTVAVTLGREGADGLRVEVADRGPGLPPHIRERLFTPHQSTKAHGSGMGLYLAHRIATGRYGGSLTLEPRAGGGTRAVLRLGTRREEAVDG